MNLTKLSGWASGVNWYVLALKAAVVGVVLFGAYSFGHHRAELACANEKASAAQRHEEAIVKYVNVKVPEIQYKDRVSVVYRDRIVKQGDKLSEVIEAKPERDDCKLSPSERELFNEQIKATQRSSSNLPK